MPSPAIAQPHDTVARYLALFADSERARGHEPSWLATLRRRAIETFERLGFPSTRDEEWRFTNLAPLARGHFERPRAAAAPPRLSEAVAPFLVGTASGPLLVFVNGRFAPEISRLDRLPAGVRAGSLAEELRRNPDGLEAHLGRYAQTDTRSFAALNTALFEDGAFVQVAPGVVLDDPVQVLFLSRADLAPAFSAPRLLLAAGENSQARVIETFGSIGDGQAFTSAVAEIAAGPGAILEHYRFQRESERSFHIGQTRLHLGRSSSISSHSVALGGLLTRHDALAVLADEGADCTLNGLYIAGGERLVDNHTEIDHAMPHGTSHELYKGILDDRARAVFNGRIKVRPDAQKTDARQTNKTLLLSDEAQINTTPQLEIFANDVKCTHGATVGQLSADALFYLRARGIGLEEARALLIRAFVGDVVNRMPSAQVRAELDRLLGQVLPGALPEGVAA